MGSATHIQSGSAASAANAAHADTWLPASAGRGSPAQLWQAAKRAHAPGAQADGAPSSTAAPAAAPDQAEAGWCEPGAAAAALLPGGVLAGARGAEVLPDDEASRRAALGPLPCPACAGSIAGRAGRIRKAGAPCCQSGARLCAWQQGITPACAAMHAVSGGAWMQLALTAWRRRTAEGAALAAALKKQAKTPDGRLCQQRAPPRAQALPRAPGRAGRRGALGRGGAAAAGGRRGGRGRARAARGGQRAH